MNTKPTNPKDAVGTNKTPMSFVPAPVMAELGLAMLEGGLKYGRHNYRAVGVRASVYYDAVMRHMLAFWEGEDTDPDSNVCHLTKAIASLVVLRDSMMRGNWVDDRPPASKPGWLSEMNEQAKALVDKYPEPKPPTTQVDWVWLRDALAVEAALVPVPMPRHVPPVSVCGND
jgi:hypothetical protein